MHRTEPGARRAGKAGHAHANIHKHKQRERDRRAPGTHPRDSFQMSRQDEQEHRAGWVEGFWRRDSGASGLGAEEWRAGQGGNRRPQEDGGQDGAPLEVGLVAGGEDGTPLEVGLQAGGEGATPVEVGDVADDQDWSLGLGVWDQRPSAGDQSRRPATEQQDWKWATGLMDWRLVTGRLAGEPEKPGKQETAETLPEATAAAEERMTAAAQELQTAAAQQEQERTTARTLKTATALELVTAIAAPRF